MHILICAHCRIKAFACQEKIFEKFLRFFLNRCRQKLYNLLDMASFKRSGGHLNSSVGYCRAGRVSKTNRGGDINPRYGVSYSLVPVSLCRLFVPSFWDCRRRKLRDDHLTMPTAANVTKSPLEGYAQLNSNVYGSWGSIEAVECIHQKKIQSWFVRSRRSKLQVQS